MRIEAAFTQKQLNSPSDSPFSPTTRLGVEEPRAPTRPEDLDLDFGLYPEYFKRIGRSEAGRAELRPLLPWLSASLQATPRPLPQHSH